MANTNVDLDLSELTKEPITVKLPDDNVYDMADPMEMSVHQYHVFLSNKKIVDEKEEEDKEWDTDDVQEMEKILNDICHAVVPDAPREVVENMGFRRKRILMETFSDQTPSGDNGQGKAVSHSA